MALIRYLRDTSFNDAEMKELLKLAERMKKPAKKSING
jgi:hypothetical protein